MEVVDRLEAGIETIDKAREICRAPSLSLGILHKGEVVYSKSLGLRDVENQLQADSDTSYYCGSLSKMLTSTAIAILVGEGKLAWGDFISTHLPDFKPLDDPSIGSKATIVDVLRHTCGLANPNAVMLGPYGKWSFDRDTHVALLNALPASDNSGQRFQSSWNYSNAMFGLLSHVIEKVSGQSFSDFMTERILRPLGMNQTFVNDSALCESTEVAHPYVLMSNGLWRRTETANTPESYPAAVACMGMRTSVNDLLRFAAAVMHRRDEEVGSVSQQSLLLGSSFNPLREISGLWDHWYWTVPYDDGFANETAYFLGWYRTTMPSSALGLTSYNFHARMTRDKAYVQRIIGTESEPRTVYGHNGVMNGSVASFYVLPESHSAVVVLANSSDAGDASASVAEILLQALFDLKPQIDLLPWVSDSRDRCLKAHDEMIAAWQNERDVTKYTGNPPEFVGTYIGLAVSRINITLSETAAAGLSVHFQDQLSSACDLEPYNADALSFLPLKHDELLAKGMLDWDCYKVGIFEFVRKEDQVLGLWWQWDELDYPGLWVRVREGMGQEDIDGVLAEFGRFRKDDQKESNGK